MPLATALVRLLPRALSARLAAAAHDTKASRTGPLIAYETLGGPVWSPRDYAAFAREGFMQNAIVYRCVRMICEAGACIPLCLYQGPQEIDDHPLLALLKSPSPHQTGTDFFESFLGYLLVSGNSYVEAVALNGELRELYSLRPDRITIIPGQSGWPDGYTYTAAGGAVTFSADVLPGVRPILHMRLFHPVDDHYGMSPIEAASVAIDIHNQASKWNKALLDNAARPSGALVYAAREGRLSPEQFERLKNELQEGFAGAKNAGRPLLLEGGLDWKPLSMSPKDMDFIEAKHAAAREIALALGVPPMLLGIPGDNTFSNYQEANRVFWRNTVVPLMTRACAALSDWLGDAYQGGPVTLQPDLDAIEALSPERDALWSRLEKTTFLTDDEKRAAIGYSPKGSPLTEPPEPRDKFNPGQPRVPSGRPNGGRWTGPNSGDGAPAAGGGGDGTTPFDPSASIGDGSLPTDGTEGSPQADPSEWPTSDNLGIIDVQAKPPTRAGSAPVDIVQAQNLQIAINNARDATQRVLERDPTWRPEPEPSLTDPNSLEGQTARYRAIEAAADRRLEELLKDVCPGTNPDWGVNRLGKERRDLGYTFKEPTRAPGQLLENEETGEQIRIMERPLQSYRIDPSQKSLSDYYYRYRSGDDQLWGGPISIPNKNR